MSTSTPPPHPLQAGAPCPTRECPGRLKQDGKALYCPVCRWRGWSPTTQHGKG